MSAARAAMRGALVAAITLLGAAGCTATTKPEASERMFARFAALADQMCACPDAACGDKVQQAMNQWAADRVQQLGDAPPPSEPGRRRLEEDAKRYRACKARLAAPR